MAASGHVEEPRQHRKLGDRRESLSLLSQLSMPKKAEEKNSAKMAAAINGGEDGPLSKRAINEAVSK